MERLGKYIEQIRGISFSPDEVVKEPQDGFVPVLRAGNLGPDGLLLEDLIYIHRERIRPEQWIKKGDVVIASSSGSKEVVGKGVSLDNDFEGSFGAFCKIVRPLNGIDAGYLKHIFKTPQYRATIKRVIQGANINNLKNEHIDDQRFLVPHPDEQRRIAALLSRAEGLIAQRKESLRLLDELVSSVFLEMFGDPVQNAKGWSMETIGSIADVRRGSSPRPIDKFMGGTVPWIKIGDGTKGDDMFITETSEFVTEDGAAKSVYLEPGSLIVSNSGVSLGFARILGIAGCVHDGWLSLTNLDEVKINKIFLLKLINMLTPVFRRRAPDGGQPNLNISIFQTYQIPTPPLDLQERFASVVEAASFLSKKHRTSLEGMEQLYGSLSQRAFRGELSSTTLGARVTPYEAPLAMRVND